MTASLTLLWIFRERSCFLLWAANKQSNKCSVVSGYRHIPERRSFVGGLFEDRMHESLWLLETVLIFVWNLELLRRDICFCGDLSLGDTVSKLGPELRCCCSPHKELFTASGFSAKYKWSFPLLGRKMAAAHTLSWEYPTLSELGGSVRAL